MIKFFISLPLLLFSVSLYSQFMPQDVIDEQYGIQGYESMVLSLDGDSTRLCDGKPCEGHLTDKYTNGEPLHKGTYLDGKLINFKNFYPDGQVERKYTLVDENRTKLLIYYPDGKLKTEVKYVYGSVKEWTDYYQNGKMEYHEKFNSKRDIIVLMDSYYEDGKPQMIMEFAKRGDKIYDKTEYYPSGKVKETGQVHYFEEISDYRKIDDWKTYDEKGKLLKIENYVNGKLNDVKRF